METMYCECCKQYIFYGDVYWRITEAIENDLKNMSDSFKEIDKVAISKLKKGDIVCEDCYNLLNQPDLFKFKRENKAWWMYRFDLRFPEVCHAVKADREPYPCIKEKCHFYTDNECVLWFFSKLKKTKFDYK